MKKNKRRKRRRRYDRAYYNKLALLSGLLVILVFFVTAAMLLLADVFWEKDVPVTNEGHYLEVQTQTETMTQTQAENTQHQTESETETETASETETETEQDGTIRVILDAGHGGNDGGTSSGKKLIEKNINLDIVNLMKPMLEEKGIEVYLTRTEDEYLGLDDRAYLANRKGGKLFVSIHCNYYKEGSDISGVECYYFPKAKIGKKCAETIISKLKENGKVKARNAKAAEYYVLKNTSMTAVLIEVGYLSSPNDKLNLGSQTYKETMARELVDGICTYLEAQNSQ